MIVGILSDTHGHAARTQAAVNVLKQCGATHFVHCGDVGGAEVLTELAGLPIDIVCGNVDCPDTPLARYADSLGLSVGLPSPRRITLDSTAALIMHGHEAAATRLLQDSTAGAALRSEYGGCPYIFHGHTHLARDWQLADVRIINPGALVRARVHTVATLDTQAQHVRFWRVTDHAPPDADPVEHLLR